MPRTYNPTVVKVEHCVAGHRNTDGSWSLQCGDDGDPGCGCDDPSCGCGWQLVTRSDITEDELDAVIDAHVAT